MSDIDVARIRHGLGAPLRLWKSSLALRVVTSALLGSFLVLMVAGVFLLYSVTQGIVSNARDSAMADANEALSEIEQQMRNLGYDYASSDAIDSIVRTAIARGDSSGRYELYVVTGTGRFSSNGFDQQAVPVELRHSVADDQQSQQAVYSQPTQVQLASGIVVPGLAVAATTSGGGLDRFLVYFVFDFQQESRTLTVVTTAVTLAALVVMIGIGLVAYLVSRQTLKPVRLARQAAEKLASGELTQLMPVRGTDDLAQLAMAMNHMANQLQQRIRQLEQLSRVQQRFVSDVSHELRTPLATVRMASDVLYDNREGLPTVERRSVELLSKELNRFQALLADLLEISRFDAGAAVLSLEDENLTGLIRGEIESLSELAATTGCEIRLHGDAECAGQMDPRRIARLIRNFLSNAIEHGDGKPIDVYVAHDADVVAFAVRDHGIGFTLEQGRQLFNRFWRADPARARHIGGTGLGLAISQEDVRLHQGWIHAWGRPGQGAQFRVVLPRSENIVVTHSPIPLIPLDAPRLDEEAS